MWEHMISLLQLTEACFDEAWTRIVGVIQREVACHTVKQREIISTRSSRGPLGEPTVLLDYRESGMRMRLSFIFLAPLLCRKNV